MTDEDHGRPKRGRRTKAEELEIEEKLPELRRRLSSMGDTEAQVMAFLDALLEARLDGTIDNVQFRDFTSAANVKLRAIRQAFQPKRLGRLEALVAQAEAIRASGIARAAADRLHQKPTPTHADESRAGARAEDREPPAGGAGADVRPPPAIRKRVDR